MTEDESRHLVQFRYPDGEWRTCCAFPNGDGWRYEAIVLTKQVMSFVKVDVSGRVYDAYEQLAIWQEPAPF